MKVSIVNRLPEQWNRDLMRALLGYVEQQLNQLSEGGIVARHAAVSSIPTTGSWAKGDIAWNSNPTSAGFIGWVCTASGSPGTWKGFGVIA